MTSLLLSPHNDDAVLWASFTLHAEKPHVITVLRSHTQERQGGPTAAEREAEDDAALAILFAGTKTSISHPYWEQWPYLDSCPDWAYIRSHLAEINDAWVEDDRKYHRAVGFHVYAPWPEPGGHEQHNRVGELARDVFGDRCRFYTTYRYGGPRTIGPVEVEPTREAILAKLQALACYRSQILRGPSRFFAMPLNEYLAA